jgi:hypothetical protein
MKRAILGHELLDKQTYEAFKATLDKMGAVLSAQMVTRYGDKQVKVEGGEILYKLESIRMTRAELEAFDEKAHWQRILDVCRQHGFSPREAGIEKA